MESALPRCVTQRRHKGRWSIAADDSRLQSDLHSDFLPSFSRTVSSPTLSTGSDWPAASYLQSQRIETQDHYDAKAMTIPRRSGEPTYRRYSSAAANERPKSYSQSRREHQELTQMYSGPHWTSFLDLQKKRSEWGHAPVRRTTSNCSDREA
eukprot:1821361-Rhodomonas_salina.1